MLTLSRRLLTAALLLLVPSGTWAAELAVEDFKFDGPLGSQGARIRKIETNHFLITLAPAPAHPNWANNCQFQITRHAKGNALMLDVAFDHPNPSYFFDEYFHSFSYDGKNWRPLQWSEEKNGRRNRLVFPAFEQDQVTFGHQAPMSFEDLEVLYAGWAKHPHAKLHVVGKSLGGRKLYRLEITDPASPHPRARRWVHYFKNVHPCEHNAHWRMAGMVDWLLSDAGADFRRRAICHFVIMMTPDGPTNGWYRVNAQGVDMNRTFRAEGPDANAQAHEAYVLQQDVETLMASETPLTSFWGIHTWPGLVDPIMTPGPEVGKAIGPQEEFGKILKHNDPKPLLKPLHFTKSIPSGSTTWNDGIHVRFGITSVLCEGAAVIDTKEDNLASGAVIMKSLSEYYRGLR